MKIDASDVATGLPPMRLIGPHSEASAIVLAGESAGEGIVAVPGTDEHLAVKYIYLRGMLLPQSDDDPDFEIQWLQRRLAIPVELVPAVIAALKVPAHGQHGR